MRDKTALHAVDKTVGQNIRKFRLASCMSQQKLGDELGVTFQQIQKYENATNRVSASRLYALAKVFGLPVGAFFSDLEYPGSEKTDDCFPSETLEIALKLEALSKQYGLPPRALSKKMGELAISLMR